MTSRPAQPIGKNQLYALLVDASGAPVLDGDGSQQVVAVQSTNGRIQVDAVLNGSLAKLSTEPDPAGEEGNTLTVFYPDPVDNRYYRYYNGAWREI